LLPFTAIVLALSRWAGGLIKHHGAKRPLTIGPVITATVFVLFTLRISVGATGQPTSRP
jgi:hypothetical protein